MAIAFPQAVLDQAFKLGNTQGFIWLLEVTVERSIFATVMFRFCSVAEIIEFPTGSGERWYPYPFRIPDLPSDSEGTVPKLAVVLPTGGYEGLRYVDAGDGLTGNQMRMLLVHRSALASASNSMEIKGRIAGVAVDVASIALSMGLIDVFRIDFPRDVYQRDRCRFRLGGPGCLFQFPVVGEAGYGDPNIMFCDKTLYGVGGCKVHGDNEVTRLLTRKHPAQFGGCYSIPIGRRSWAV